MLSLTILLAPFVYEHATTIRYFENRSMLTYLPNNLNIFRGQGTIDGVFENNPYKASVNGSLWTIRYEVLMYIIISFLFIFRKNPIIVKTSLLVAFSALIIGNIFFFAILSKIAYIVSGAHLLDLGAFFIGGSLLAALKFENKANWPCCNPWYCPFAGISLFSYNKIYFAANSRIIFRIAINTCHQQYWEQNR